MYFQEKWLAIVTLFVMAVPNVIGSEKLVVSGGWQQLFEGQILTEIVDIEVKGYSVAVLTNSFPAIYMADEYRKLNKSWGTKGQGPGELQNPISIAIIGDSVLVLDRTPPKVEIYSLDGVHQKTVSFDAFMLAHSLKANDHGWWVELAEHINKDPYVVVSGQKPEKMILNITDGEKMTLKAGFPLTMAKPFTPQQIWCPLENGLAFWDGKATSVVVLDAQGNKQGEIPFTEGKIPIKTADKEHWIAKNFPVKAMFGRQDFNAPFRKQLQDHEFPKQFPQIIALEPDANDGVWALRSKGSGGQVWTWLRQEKQPIEFVSPSGKEIKAFGSSFIAAISTNDQGDEGVEIIKR